MRAAAPEAVKGDAIALLAATALKLDHIQHKAGSSFLRRQICRARDDIEKFLKSNGGKTNG